MIRIGATVILAISLLVASMAESENRLNYRAEIRTYVINPCLVGLAKIVGLYDPNQPRKSRETMRRMLKNDLAQLKKGILTMMPIEVPFEKRRQLYSYMLAVCLKSSDMVK